jgi:hypothetical protein
VSFSEHNCEPKCSHLLLGVIRGHILQFDPKLRLIPKNCMDMLCLFVIHFCSLSQSKNVLINVGIVAENALNSIIKKDVVDMVCAYDDRIESRTVRSYFLLSSILLISVSFRSHAVGLTSSAVLCATIPTKPMCTS